MMKIIEEVNQAGSLSLEVNSAQFVFSLNSDKYQSDIRFWITCYLTGQDFWG